MRIVACAGLASAIVVHAPRARGQPSPPPVDGANAPELVSEFPCPDPFIFHDGVEWSILGTGARPFLLHGERFGGGRMRKVFLDIDYGDFPLPVAQIWGFIVHRRADGAYHAYGTLHLGRFRTVIAHFEPGRGARWEPGRPITSWRFTNLVVGDPERQDWSAYESKILVDADGSEHLMYVTTVDGDNHIVARKLRSPREIDPDSPRRTLLRPDGYRSEDRNGPGGMQLVEGGSIHRVGDMHVLLYSVGDFKLPNYKLGMAFCDSLIPPPGRTYRKVRLPDPRHVWGPSDRDDEIGYLLQSQRPEWPNDVGAHVVGPGLGSIVVIDGAPWLFFHGYEPGDETRDPSRRFVFRMPLTVAVRQGDPTVEWLRVNVPARAAPVPRAGATP